MRDINFQHNKNGMTVFELTSIADNLEVLIDYHNRFSKPNPDDATAENMEQFFLIFDDFTKGYITSKQQREMQDE